ncbi:MAG: hypothetical protein JSW39_15750, partial [Desulfobacterales bacterium]
LFNIVKHAQAENAVVSIRKEGQDVDVEIQDDGVGFDLAEADARGTSTDGFGLFSIRERLSHLRGRLEIQTTPGGGTRIRMRLPLSCREPIEARRAS